MKATTNLSFILYLLAAVMLTVGCTEDREDGGTTTTDAGQDAPQPDLPTDTASDGAQPDLPQDLVEDASQPDGEPPDLPRDIPGPDLPDDLEEPDLPADTPELPPDCQPPCGPGQHCEHGVCVPDQDCIPEGGVRPVIPDAPPCCEGLEPIGCEEPDENGQCPAEPCGGGAYCARCGNGGCGPGENVCNCPQDCGGGQCVPEGDQYVEFEEPDAECCEGLVPRALSGPVDGECVVIPCGCFVCVSCPDGECGPGEDICICPEDCGGGQCVPEGEEYNELDDPDAQCCEGLEPVVAAMEMPDGLCSAPRCPCFVCVSCGDGLCGLGENVCNCHQDCENLPECTPEGESHAAVPGAPPCCPGLDTIGCEQPDEEGNCPMGCEGGVFCARCPNGECGPGENPCNCPEDCGGQVECTQEGESYNELDDPHAPCCPGLEPIPLLVEAGEGCDAPACPCFVCARCGNGECGPGENVCNCEDDCCPQTSSECTDAGWDQQSPTFCVDGDLYTCALACAVICGCDELMELVEEDSESCRE